MLPKKYRLCKNASFRYLYNRGKFVRSDKLIVYYKKSNATKFGFSVSNKIGKAVVRNKIKRRLSNIMFKVLKKTNQKYQIILVAKVGIEKCSYDDLTIQVEANLKKIGFL